jgi:hypothetical protein
MPRGVRTQDTFCIHVEIIMPDFRTGILRGASPHGPSHSEILRHQQAGLGSSCVSVHKACHHNRASKLMRRRRRER